MIEINTSNLVNFVIVHLHHCFLKSFLTLLFVIKLAAVILWKSMRVAEHEIALAFSSQ